MGDRAGCTRRGFVTLAGAGLALGLLPLGTDAADDSAAAGLTSSTTGNAGAGLAQPFVRIAPSGEITVLIKHLEMGQGISTGLATILADALDADWARVRTQAAPVNPALYKHLVFGAQTTGGSTSVSNSWQQLREAGAVARAMLLQAAAARWGVPADQLSTHRSQVLHGVSGRRLDYGALVDAAALLPVPTAVRLRPVSASGLIGHHHHRLDQADMLRGATRYGIDIQRPGMRVALILRPPRFGATVRSVNDHAARAVKGVRGVHVLGAAGSANAGVNAGVAVVADNTWSAMQARGLLQVEWDDSTAEKRGSAELWAEFHRLADVGEPGVDGLLRGDVGQAMAGAAQVLSADFELPYLAHQAMEPLAAVAEWTNATNATDATTATTATTGQPAPGARCQIWAASQSPSADHAAAVRLLGLAPAQIDLHVLPAGGSFGRRATFSADWISALLQVLLAHRAAGGGDAPIKLMWTREDDVAGGFYRPMNLHRVRAGLGADGKLVAVDHTIVAQSFLFGAPKPGVAVRHDPTATEGHLAGRYDVPNARLRWVNAAVGVPVQMYRALGYNHTSFSKEVLMDELARLAGQDPLAFRLAHLGSHPRQAAVLKKAAALAGWGTPQPAGRALGLAVQEAYKTFVAQVVQLRIDAGQLMVERVVCVVDCGTVINPDTVRAQMEGGIAFGLSAALHGQITLDAGVVQQRNFHDAPVLRLHEMPAVEVLIMASDEPPTGVGEPGSVPILAALANALARLTGKPVRSMPLRLNA